MTSYRSIAGGWSTKLAIKIGGLVDWLDPRDTPRVNRLTDRNHAIIITLITRQTPLRDAWLAPTTTPRRSSRLFSHRANINSEMSKNKDSFLATIKLIKILSVSANVWRDWRRNSRIVHRTCIYCGGCFRMRNNIDMYRTKKFVKAVLTSFWAKVGVIGPSLASHLSAMRIVSAVFCCTDFDSSSSVSS